MTKFDSNEKRRRKNAKIIDNINQLYKMKKGVIFMPNTTTESTLEERQRIARMQAEYERRKGILQLIETKDREIQKYKELVTAFKAYKGPMAELAGILQGAGTSYSPPASGDFSGISAAEADQGIQEAVETAGTQGVGLLQVSGAIGEQIGLLQEEIGRLDVEIEGLRRSL